MFTMLRNSLALQNHTQIAAFCLNYPALRALASIDDPNIGDTKKNLFNSITTKAETQLGSLWQIFALSV